MERASDEHGVYAYADMAGAMDRISSRAIVAEVDAEGDVQVYDSGWHADAATITRIYLPAHYWRMRPALLDRYGVPVEPLSRLTASPAVWTIIAASHYPSTIYAVAIAPARDVAVHVADLISTCAACHPGRVRDGSAGICYLARKRRDGLRGVPVLPAAAVSWTRRDALDWFDAQGFF
jgi:hypothetical protein